jgi:hypothetical protein
MTTSERDKDRMIRYASKFLATDSEIQRWYLRPDSYDRRASSAMARKAAGKGLFVWSEVGLENRICDICPTATAPGYD